MNLSAEHSKQAAEFPPERFYWAAFDLPGAGALVRNSRSTRNRAVLDEAFATHLPCGIEEVVPAYGAIGPDRVLACGLPREQFLDAVGIETLQLSPSHLPEWAEGAPVEFNLLVGAWEPALVRHARNRRLLIGSLGMIVLAGLAAVGIERRAVNDATRAREAEDRLTLIGSLPFVNELCGGATGGGSLGAALSRVRAAVADSAELEEPDAAMALGTLLSHWPKETGAQVGNLSVTTRGISLETTLPSHAAAEQFTDAMRSIPGLRSDRPQLTVQAGKVRLRIELARGIQPRSPVEAPR